MKPSLLLSFTFRNFCIEYISCMHGELTGIRSNSSRNIPTSLGRNGVLFISTMHEGKATSICKRTLTKRLLRMIGVNPNKSPCLINTRREMAHIIDTALDDIRERALAESKEIDIEKEWLYAKRGKYGKYDGQYCCSPTCDRYMAHLGVNPQYVAC